MSCQTGVGLRDNDGDDDGDDNYDDDYHYHHKAS